VRTRADVLDPRARAGAQHAATADDPSPIPAPPRPASKGGLTMQKQAPQFSLSLFLSYIAITVASVPVVNVNGCLWDDEGLADAPIDFALSSKHTHIHTCEMGHAHTHMHGRTLTHAHRVLHSLALPSLTLSPLPLSVPSQWDATTSTDTCSGSRRTTHT
jgi:hypothetical protein